jgi:hypothetical protein
MMDWRQGLGLRGVAIDLKGHSSPPPPCLYPQTKQHCLPPSDVLLHHCPLPFPFASYLTSLRLLVRATNERFLPTWRSFRHGLANESHWLQLATSAGTRRSLMTRTRKCGWAISVWPAGRPASIHPITSNSPVTCSGLPRFFNDL